MSDRLPTNSDFASVSRPRLEAAPTRPRTAYPLDSGDPDIFDGGREGVGFDTVRLREYARVLYRRRWTAMTVFCVVLAGTIIHTYSRVEVPVYEARVRLLVEPERRVAGSRPLDSEALALIDFQTQHAIVNSHAFARKAMEALQIWEPADYAAARPKATPQSGFSPYLSWATVKSFFSSEPRHAPAQDGAAAAVIDTPELQAARIRGFLAGVTVNQVPKSRLIEIGYRSIDPDIAARYANVIGQQYIAQNLEFKFLATQEASAWLSERLVEQRRRVEDAEKAVREYRQRNQVVASADERAKAAIQRLGELTTAVTRVKTERIERETAFNRLKGIGEDRAALEALPEVASDPTVQTLKAELAAATRQHAQLAEKIGERHPDLIKAQKNVETTKAKLDAAVDNVVKVIRSEYHAAVAAENSLTQVYEQQKRDAMQTNQTDVDFAVLQRDFESNRQIYDAMLQQARESEVAGQPTTNNIRILDPAAVPRVPQASSKMRELQTGAAAGLALALLFVWFFEYIDNRIKSPSDIQQYLRIPYLGLIPALPGSSAHPSDPLVSGDVPFQFSESFRGIRTNVLFSTAKEGTRAVVVTSAHPGEGKTVASCNLAVSLAQAGQRVLLIDADLRRPRVHQVFGFNQEPGLSNLLVGSSPASEVVRRTSVPGLSLMAAGHIPPNPAELLGSNRFVEFIARLEPHFDWVIIDSPPAVPVTDPAVLAHNATATILVVSAEKTSRYGAREALDRLEAAGGRVLGVILNYVSLDDNPYYYARQYKTYYAAYEPGAKVKAG
ncbi:MAG TPA: polysaccharide biosynthesis tyrosine autokinase [Vicinamibacterales bacterium]|nr:polysaccharide biosynthesis tyrosine autokinase [Vicinamibacterales bacterium]